jgi:hypothetical protein
MTSPPAIPTLDRAQALNDKAFYQFYVAHPNGRFERTSLGDIIIPPRCRNYFEAKSKALRNSHSPTVLPVPRTPHGSRTNAWPS